MRSRKTTYVLGTILLLLALTWVFFHRQLNQSLSTALLLRSPSPREEVFEQVANGLANPTPLLERCWATAKVPHRQLVASFLRNQEAANPKWSTNAQRLVLGGTIDPDMSVRELALAILQSRKDPDLFRCASAQLRDPDPLVRQLGLQYLRQVSAQQGVPVVMGLLDDPDLRVVASAEVALMRWTGQDFGVRTHLAIPVGEADHQLDPSHVDTIRHGVERRKEWWQAHAHEFPPETASSKPPTPDFTGPPAEDFSLPDLQGTPVRLSDFRGKTVLVNFWATWCTACVAEIPDLIELHKKLGDRVVILGVALDGLPDEHGHQAGDEGGSLDGEGLSRKAVLKKVLRTVNDRGINYPVLLDPDAKVGGRFNGGELPTTVIIDSQGHLRRRFIGERNVQVFEAMLAEIAH